MTIDRALVVALFVTGVLGPGARAAAPLELTRDDTVVVRANEAWEEPGRRIAHFRGNFELLAPDWSVAADRAVVYGPLEDPERVVVDGAPAQIRMLKSNRRGELTGQGRHIEYRRDEDAVSLSGEAQLRDGERTLTSSMIVYDLAAGRVRAGGEEGVEIVVPPRKRD